MNFPNDHCSLVGKEFQFSFNFQNKYEIQFWINGAKDMHAFHYMDVQFVVCKYMQTSSPN